MTVDEMTAAGMSVNADGCWISEKMDVSNKSFLRK